jgi:hypothetical protein
VQGVEIMTLSDVKNKYERSINEICDTLHIPYETAVLAMRQYNWYEQPHLCFVASVSPRAVRLLRSLPRCLRRDAHRIADTWYADPEEVKRTVGVAFPDSAPTPNPDKQVSLPQAPATQARLAPATQVRLVVPCQSHRPAHSQEGTSRAEELSGLLHELEGGRDDFSWMQPLRLQSMLEAVPRSEREREAQGHAADMPSVR